MGKSFARVDWDELEEVKQEERRSHPIRLWVIPLAAVLCGLQAYLNLQFENAPKGAYLIATQISVISFGFLLILSLVVNPFLRLLRVIRPFSRAELMAMFAAMAVSAGISSFGLTDQIIPLIASPFNTKWNLPQRGWSETVIPHLNPRLYITDPNVIETFRTGLPEGTPRWQAIPWMAWLKPLAFWMIFVAGIYAIFYSLSALLYERWGRREKLVFPLARLPEDLLPDEGATAGRWPATLRRPLFWIGFGTVFVLLSYNGMCQAEWIRGLTPISLGVNQLQLTSLLDASIFKGIAHTGPSGLAFVIIFTAVGIAYLLPPGISLSLWGYKLVGVALMMVAIWMKFGASVRSFPTDFTFENNFVTALGGGGLLAFSTILLVHALVDTFSGRGAAEEEDGARVRASWTTTLTSPACMMGLSFLISAGWLRWNGIGWGWSFAFLGTIILITIGLMRVVAEGGVYWFQIHTGPFHLVKVLGGAGALPGAVLAPLVPIYSVLFLDIKTHMAPAVLNSFKMREEARASRRRFHLTVLIAILATVLVSFIVLLDIAYCYGANRCGQWFFTNGPISVLDRAVRLSRGQMGDLGRSLWIFYLIGAAWVGLSVVIRRRWFWWLHPIGFIMLANGLMTPLWFSFFIGWMCKKITLKYGGRHMFARVRPFFVGLILGELLAALLWSVLAQWLDLRYVQIDINRANPG